jgi:hypothetical protein
MMWTIHVQSKFYCFTVHWLSLQPHADAGSSLSDFSSLKMEAIRFSETSVYTIYKRRYIPEDDILQNIS